MTFKYSFLRYERIGSHCLREENSGDLCLILSISPSASFFFLDFLCVPARVAFYLSLSSSYVLYFLRYPYSSLSLPLSFSRFLFHSVKTSSNCANVISILYATRISKYSCGRVTIIQIVYAIHPSHGRKFATFHGVSLRIRGFISVPAYYFPALAFPLIPRVGRDTERK